MKFAHIADAHLGAFSKNPPLRDLNLLAFQRAIEKCVEEEVDFILIAGDLFHNPIPNMDIVKKSVEIMKIARDAGIRIYVIYGSHDFSLGSTSLLDVLASAGIFKKVVKMERGERGIILREVKDESGVSIVGISGLSSSAEVKYFEILDREYLERIENPKIFAFHTTIEELKPSYIADKHAVPKSLLPSNFDYYAGGHLHEKIVSSLNGSPLIYPGALFGATYNDLDILEKRGFFIVENFKPRFQEIKVCDFFKKVINADGLTARELNEELLSLAGEDYTGKVVILKVRGELKAGRIADINFHEIREKFKESAIDVLINTYALRKREEKIREVIGETKEEIEENVFREISKFGLNFTKELFHILRERKPDDMSNRVFEERLWSRVYSLLLTAGENMEGEEKSKEVKKEDRNKEEKERVSEKEERGEGREKKREVRKRERRKKESGKTTLFDFMEGA